mgnify:CR=1 FL=1|jgi:hypothetical protein
MKTCASCKTKQACKKAGKCLGKVKADKESRKGLAGKMTEGSY